MELREYFVTAEGKAELLKWEWEETQREINNLREMIREDSEAYGEGDTSIPAMVSWELNEELEELQDKHREAAFKYCQITGNYPSDLPF